ncbi:diphthine--ammonia ligase [Jeongeupia naejangsanensis]|uniref:Diphthine--ammonia ligase n=1 Tax=Jeongeupia naejangsanensis TaxID=613195 RepID=A0ABS2BLT4_9NEIS|nr:diphthine--ammonia ligase [Jeongeupia naejangsanensis]MBM3115744.1 diphthine--ammonia ligase [Jeongeupia naejangsanensis]
MTTPLPPIVGSWSGGKDSCLAFHRAVAAGHEPVALITMLDETGERSRSHGIPPILLRQQAAALGVPLITGDASWSDYEAEFILRLARARDEFGAQAAVFGDIDLQAHRDWEEMVCKRTGLAAQLPLWQQDRRALVGEMIACGIRTMIVSCNEALGPDFLGRIIDAQTVADLDAAGVDVCGENGEYHTLVLDAPRFAAPLSVTTGEKQRHGHYWFIELFPA